jgi:hypothetical protein
MKSTAAARPGSPGRPPAIRTLGTESARFFLLGQDGEAATGAEIIGFSTALRSPDRATPWPWPQTRSS